MLAQRALDRRLTEELIRFKANVSALTNELDAVKAHDHEVTKQAIQVHNGSSWRSSKDHLFNIQSSVTEGNLN